MLSLVNEFNTKHQQRLLRRFLRTWIGLGGNRWSPVIDGERSSVHSPAHSHGSPGAMDGSKHILLSISSSYTFFQSPPSPQLITSLPTSGSTPDRNSPPQPQRVQTNDRALLFRAQEKSPPVCPQIVIHLHRLRWKPVIRVIPHRIWCAGDQRASPSDGTLQTSPGTTMYFSRQSDLC